MNSLLIWNSVFEERLNQLNLEQKKKPGSLLAIIRSRAEWEQFLVTVKNEWPNWQEKLHWRPACLLALYGGLAFYEYRENAFWQQFANAVGVASLSSIHPGRINSDFADAAYKHHLSILHRDGGHDYVGSAVYHIGVPLSLWSGFLEICEWGLWQDEWEIFSDVEWKEAVGKRIGNRPRLLRFLTDNREAATDSIREMLYARQQFSEDENLTISEVKDCLFLRDEYLEEVPETADFLRPANPDSLFRDRARLVWEEQRDRICLYLPAVSRAKLPATWRIADIEQTASATPDTMVLNAAAFTSHLSLELDTYTQAETQRLRGLSPWGLFDLQRNNFVNPEREQLPTGSYAVISPSKLDIARRGFDEEENPLNEAYELRDGSTCYVTRLCPRAKNAEIEIICDESTKGIRFRARARVETRILAGTGNQAFRFRRTTECLQVERLPLICVSVPTGYVNDSESAVRSKVEVVVADKQNCRVCGGWERYSDGPTGEREFFFWRWDDRPLRKSFEASRHHGWDKEFWETIKPNYELPDLTGRQTILIRSAALGLKDQHTVDVLPCKPLPEECWKNLPGDYLLWVLLCQSSEEMKWEEIIGWRDLLAAEQKNDDLLHRQLYGYARHGLLRLQREGWTIAESRARLQDDEMACELSFCGDPSILWGLYRHIAGFTSDAAAKPAIANSPAVSSNKQAARLIKKKPASEQLPSSSFPVIEVACSSRLPFLKMRWRLELSRKIQTYLKQCGVRLVSDLWRP
jgi:hypothetical protein